MVLVERAEPSERPQVDALAHVGEVGEVVDPLAVQTMQVDLAGEVGDAFLAESLLGDVPRVRAPLDEQVGGGVAPQHVVTPLEDGGALVLGEVLVAPGVAEDLELHALRDPLRVLDQRVCGQVLDRALDRRWRR